MKKIILTVSAIALTATAAQAQLLGGLRGVSGGQIDSTITGTIDRTTNTVRGAADGNVSTDGDQSVDARQGSVSANRNANGSLTGSTASLADLPVPGLTGSANGSGSATGQGSADAQLIGTETVAGAIAPISSRARGVVGSTAEQASSATSGIAGSVPMAGLPASANGAGSTQSSGSASMMSNPLSVAGSAASAAQGATSVTPGMPVVTPGGASLGKVSHVVADSRGQVHQVVVQQGRVTRTLPAGMFSAGGNALIAGEAQGQADASEGAEPNPAEGEEAK